MKKVVGSVFNSLGNIWDTVILVFIVILLLIRLAPVPFGYEPVVCLSNSMAPTFYTNSLCYVDTNYDVDSIEKGDIVAFELGDGSLVTHRVVKVETDSVITKGDANADVDFFPVSKSNIVGENVFQIPFIGILFYGFPNSILVKIGAVALIIKIFLDVVASLLLKDRRVESGEEKTLEIKGSESVSTEYDEKISDDIDSGSPIGD